MEARYDVAIVGGGPAGLSTALHLLAAAPRLRVVVLERATYPRDKICAGAIAGRAFAVLRAIGVDAQLDAVPCVRIDAGEAVLAGGRARVVVPEAARVVRRSEFDAALAAIARGRGIELRTGARVVGLRRHDRAVAVGLASGDELVARAVVGADGVAGVTRRLAGFGRGRLRAQAVEVDTEGAPDDPPATTLRFTFDPTLRGYLWDFPTPVDGRLLWSRGAYLLRDDARGDVRAHLAAHLARRGLTLDAHRPRQLAEQGLAPHAPLATPRVLLVGEAAGIDFPTGEGIAQAIAYGQVAGPYLAAALARDRIGFGDWARVWHASDEGRFLRRRHLGGRLLFGPRRPLVERALLRTPSLLRLALERFAGRPVRRRDLAGALALGLYRSWNEIDVERPNADSV